MMFDGAVAATVADTAMSADVGVVQDADSSSDNSNAAVTPPAASGEQRQEIIFVDSSVQEYQQLVSGFSNIAEVVILDGGRDGLQQIAEYLSGRDRIDAIHLFGHGDAGKVQLGTLSLGNENLESKSRLLAAIGQSLSNDGDILLYGCDIGAGTIGATFVQSLANLTDADVAASTDVTGAESQGGDWLLEINQGSIETTVLQPVNYQGVLATVVTESFNSDPTGGAAGAIGVSVSWGGKSFDLSGAGGGDLVGMTYQRLSSGEYSPGKLGLESLDINFATQETFRISPTGGPIALYGLDVDNSPGTQSVTVAGYRNGMLVDSKSVANGQSVTLDFNGIVVDEVRMTASDIAVFIDNFRFSTNLPPEITNASYNASTGMLSVTTSGMLAGDIIDSSKLTLVGEGGATYTLTSGTTTATSATAFSILLNAADRAAINLIFNRNGTISTGGTTFNLAAATGWDVTQIAPADLTGNVITASNVAVPVITSSTYDAATGTLAVSGSGFTHIAGASNDVVASKLTLTGQNGASYTLTDTANVEITSGSHFTLTLSASDRAAIQGLLNRNGSSSTSGTTYNLGAAEDWLAGAAPAVAIADLTGNGITVSNANNAPLAGNDSYSLAEDSALTGGSVLSNDTDADGNTLSAELISGPANGSLTLNANGTFTYIPNANYYGTDTFIYRAFDGAAYSNHATVTVTVAAVNDAPTLSAGPYTWAATNEDTTSTIVSVSSLLTTLSANDVDSPSIGIAVTAGSGNGAWQYSTDGANWYNVGTTSSSAALLLSSSTQLRFVPGGLNGGTSTLNFRAWDQSIGSATAGSTRSTADTTTNGGSTSFSSSTGEAGLSVNSVNDAPVLTPVAPTLNALTDTEVNSAGQAVSSFAGANIGDIDSGAVTGIALTGLDSGNGRWQYSVNGGTSWQDVGSVSTSAALLLRGSDRVRFVPDGINSTSASITYHAWDQSGATSGQQGSKIDASVTGGTSSFSSANDTASVTVTAFNDAPLITVPVSITVTEDVATPLTGISFSDIDAGASSLTVTLLVPSGSLTATSANGVTVGGSASSVTLSGSLSDINAFIATGGVLFTTAANATSDVSLTIEVNDGGNTGSGGAKSDTATVILDVSAINDAPVNSLPGPQSVDQDATLVFSSGNGNPISISDLDAGSGDVQVTLSTSNGLLTLGGTTGLSFIGGDGSFDSSMTFIGRISDINNALNGLVFSPTAGYNGAASLHITTDDLGTSGSGGAQTDTDTLAITVNSLSPTIIGVTATTANGTYRVGDTISITTTFSQVVTVDTTGGVPMLLLETGLTDRSATYVSGSGSNSLTFAYTVQAGDLNADLDYQSAAALSLNGATIRDAVTSDDAVLTLFTPGASGSLGANKALVVDGVRPAASSITLSDTALRIGETATVTVTFNEAVLGLDIADFSVANGSLSGLSSSDGGLTWTATFTPSGSTTDASNIITLDNSGVMDLAGNIGSGSIDSNNYVIDTQRPTAVIQIADSTLKAGQSTTVTVTFSEAVTGLTTADFSVANGTLSSLSTSDNITWTATLTPNGNITDSSNLITLDNTGLQDAAGNAGIGSTDSDNYTIDTQRPTASIIVADTALKAGQNSTVTITFSEAVSGLSTADFSVANGTLSNLASSDGGITWTATLTPSANVTDPTNLITLDNTGYSDAAGNTGTGSTDSNNYAMDTQRPAATIVVGDDTLAIGETTVVTIIFNEAVTGLSLADFSVANGTLSNLSTSDNVTYTAILTPNGNVSDSSNLIILDDVGYTDAAGNTGTGSTDSNNYAIDTQRPTATIQLSDAALAAGDTATVTITFNEAVTGLTLADLSATNGTLGGLSSNDGGITWTATLTPNANATASNNLITLDNTGVQDAAGNIGMGATLSNNYAVDTVVPLIGSVSVPAGIHYAAGDTLTFVVNASEAVLVDGTPRLALDIGGSTVFADYVAGSGTTALVFRYSVQPGLNDADGITVSGLQNNGGSLRDATGNAVNLTLNNVGDTSGIRIDTIAPSATIALDPASSIATQVRYTVTFSEDVSGVDLSDFSLVTSGSISGSLGNLVQIDARTYQITITNVVGGGSLALALNGGGTGIGDAAGNTLAGGLVGQPFVLSQVEGDPEFRSAAPTVSLPDSSRTFEPAQSTTPPSPFTSPLLPAPLFEQPTLGSGIPTTGDIFINRGQLAPSYLAQVFASSDRGAGASSGVGFLGFGGGDGGVFGTSSFSSIFAKEVSQESEGVQLRWGRPAGSSLAGAEMTGAPTLSQQLHQIGESEQRQVRDLAWALGQMPLKMPEA